MRGNRSSDLLNSTQSLCFREKYVKSFSLSERRRFLTVTQQDEVGAPTNCGGQRALQRSKKVLMNQIKI